MLYEVITRAQGGGVGNAVARQKPDRAVVADRVGLDDAGLALDGGAALILGHAGNGAAADLV